MEELKIMYREMRERMRETYGCPDYWPEDEPELNVKDEAWVEVFGAGENKLKRAMAIHYAKPAARIGTNKPLSYAIYEFTTQLCSGSGRTMKELNIELRERLKLSGWQRSDLVVLEHLRNFVARLVEERYLIKTNDGRYITINSFSAFNGVNAAPISTGRD